jgi:glycine/D-amino acid oxidase-like deaminating enzyme
MVADNAEPPSIAVVGAGIIGVAIAFALRRRGYPVTLIDRGEPGRGASFGNMASIAVRGGPPEPLPRRRRSTSAPIASIGSDDTRTVMPTSRSR